MFHSIFRLLIVFSFSSLFLIACERSNTSNDLPTNSVQQNDQHKTVEQTVTAPIVALKVGEGFVNPIGYYEAKPRFSWQLAKNFNGLYQSAYQIQVASHHAFNEQQILWDSTKVTSSDNAWIRYQGDKLQARQKAYWRVKVWNENNIATNWSAVQSIELGLLTNDDWQANWIGHPDTEERFSNNGENKRYKTPDNLLFRPQYLRTSFHVKGEITKARLYITSKGVFKPYINGQQVSEDVMTPGWTPYHKRIETLTYDVSHQLNQGENALAAMLAEGWHSGRIFGPSKKEYMLPMRLLAQLEITYQDGTQQIIVSNDNWQSSIQGPIRAASNYDGEFYDANFEMANWHKTPFDIDDKWLKVVSEPIDPQVALTPKRHATVRAMLTLPAVDIVSEKDGVVIYDMGQNMVGVPEINVPAIAGQKIKLRFTEAMEGEHFHVKSLRSAKNTDYYLPKTTGKISYQPTFTFHGYRYLELSGYDTSQKPSLDWVKGKVWHSNFDVYNQFTSSHAKLNKLSENVVWGLRGNFLDIPTDCPQRDERLGWTGDAQIFASTSMYKADVYGFWSAWLQSVREEQSIDGMIPKFVPFRQVLADGPSSGWGDAAVIVPWDLYMMTGDKSILADNYTMMKRWLKYHEVISYQFISNMGTYGDWLQPFSIDNKREGDTNAALISTAYFARSAYLTAKTAEILGYHSDAKQYQTLFTNISQKFRQFFFDENMNLVTEAEHLIKRDQGKRLRKHKTVLIKPNATQTSYLLPLAFDMFSAEEAPKAVAILLEIIKQTDGHLRTGFLGTGVLHDVLQKYGYSDVMYDILFKESYPSWFYSINNGATTTWERWNSYSYQDGFNKANMNSLNHYAYGAVAKFFYEGILGIKATTPGFKTFDIAPQFNAKLSHADGGYLTPQGEIRVSWKIVEQELIMTIVVPKNSQAKLTLAKVENVNISKNGQLMQAQNKLEPGVYQISGTIAL